jgi:putative lumazine-binding protein
MKKLVLALVALLVVLLAVVNLGLLASPSEEAAVRAAAEHYLRGHATGDPGEFRKAFHPELRRRGRREDRARLPEGLPHRLPLDAEGGR